VVHYEFIDPGGENRVKVLGGGGEIEVEDSEICQIGDQVQEELTRSPIRELSRRSAWNVQMREPEWAKWKGGHSILFTHK